MKKLNQKMTVRKKAQIVEKVESGLACFVNDVKTNLWCSMKNMKKRYLTPSTIRNAEELEEEFKAWGSRRPSPQGPGDSGNHLLMDYLMHHRVGLATEIVKSMANGRGLTRQREKVLRNSIDYIEQRL